MARSAFFYPENKNETQVAGQSCAAVPPAPPLPLPLVLRQVRSPVTSWRQELQYVPASQLHCHGHLVGTVIPEFSVGKRQSSQVAALPLH